MDKKKRHNSGSRSKSQKSKPNDFSVDLKPNKAGGYWRVLNEQSKTKTESSVGKSKNSKKNSKSKRPAPFNMKQSTFERKKSTKDSKMISHVTQDISHSVSAQRKFSLSKMNRTEANYFEQDFDRKIGRFKSRLSKLEKPEAMDPHSILGFYKSIQKQIERLQDPLHDILSYLHSMYFQPYCQLYEMVSPYSDLINKKNRIQKQLEHTAKQVEELRNGLDPESLQILRLKQLIVNNAVILEQQSRLKRKKSSKGYSISSSQHQSINSINKRQYNQIKRSYQEPQSVDLTLGKIHQISQQLPSEGIGLKGLKINIQSMAKNSHQGFHDQFYSHLQQFSQSWRNQAIRQKRF